MHPHSARIELAKHIRVSADELLEASERAYELKMDQLSSELLDLASQLIKTAVQILELGHRLSAALSTQELAHQLPLPGTHRPAA